MAPVQLSGSQRTSLWLLTDPATERLLTLAIVRMAERLGSTPFRPHMTLVGAVPAGFDASRLHDVAAVFPLSPLPFVDTAYLDDVHRACILRIDPHAARPAFDLLAGLFPVIPHEHFRDEPHVSLAYTVRPHGERRHARERERALPAAFAPAALACVRTSDPVEQWTPEIEIPLGSPS